MDWNGIATLAFVLAIFTVSEIAEILKMKHKGDD